MRPEGKCCKMHFSVSPSCSSLNCLGPFASWRRCHPRTWCEFILTLTLKHAHTYIRPHTHAHPNLTPHPPILSVSLFNRMRNKTKWAMEWWMWPASEREWREGMGAGSGRDNGLKQKKKKKKEGVLLPGWMIRLHWRIKHDRGDRHDTHQP